MIKRIAAAAILVVLSGCASTREVLADEPTGVFHSDRSADEVAFCLANKNNTAPMPREDGSRVVLVKNGYGGTALAFSIFPEGSGSRIEYRRKFGVVGAAWKQCVGIKPEE